VGVEGCPLCGGEEAPLHAATQAGRFRCCVVCTLVFRERDQLPSEAAERAHYETHRNDPGDPRYRVFLARLADPLAARLPPGAEGLDYGSGPGPAVPAMMRERGFPTWEWDPIYHTDSSALERSYDFVTCTEVVEHFHRPDRDFARLDALLRPGGWLGVMTEEAPAPEAFAGWRYARDPTHVVFYGMETMEWIAAWRGWRLHRPRANVFLFHKPGSPESE
jgi:SAM-dependent methyltransferase